MSRRVMVEGEWYHANDEGELLREEDGSLIPASICLCFAHGPSECVCGAWDDQSDDYEPEWD